MANCTWWFNHSLFCWLLLRQQRTGPSTLHCNLFCSPPWADFPSTKKAVMDTWKCQQRENQVCYLASKTCDSLDIASRLSSSAQTWYASQIGNMQSARHTKLVCACPRHGLGGTFCGESRILLSNIAWTASSWASDSSAPRSAPV